MVGSGVLFPPMKHEWNIRVYYEDTDAGGVVYYANYLGFAERARTEILRQLGIEQSVMLEQDKVGFVVRKCTVEYIRPARLDDFLTIETTLHDMSKAKLIMRQIIKRAGEVLVELEVLLTIINMDTNRVARMPEHVFSLLQQQTISNG